MFENESSSDVKLGRVGPFTADATDIRHGTMVEFLCRAKVPPEIKKGWYWNMEWDSLVPILQTLLAFNANPDKFIADKEPGFPLISAACNGCLRAVELLLDAGARVNLSLPHFYGTALQAAVSQGHLEVAEYLIEKTSDINVPRSLPLEYPDSSRDDGISALQTPVQLAAKNNNLALLQMLLERGASVSACPVSACPNFESYYPYKATLKRYWLRYGPQYNKHYLVYTALQYGVINQNLNIVELLLSAGADPDSRVAPGIGDTPLQMAARLGNLELARLLLSSGADVNAPPLRLTTAELHFKGQQRVETGRSYQCFNTKKHK
ncbi:ankyrin repeat domain-containing protein [Aspergillus clavatus NRRL 1]|uniref:Ankyrin repeat protein n=1 Tax=Aspergillus clavatus (strain ATCC 1007 / CBS 513.65 / DSM 816 / NCTC 3887 / NRRL 1 / QM 1276 / 107) TaxID=344612 RepID=A1CLR6_ASPCL|nr:Ankyrin repeat protein [Aspergillus clavatus NRRL 1]EAW09045.1 Ankyrin repeat protein [Aspergillus clavatus NRRL 1]